MSESIITPLATTSTKKMSIKNPVIMIMVAVMFVFTCYQTFMERSFFSSLSSAERTAADGQYHSSKELNVSENIPRSKKDRPKIAIISGFVPSSQYLGPGPPRISETNLDLILNKACYSYLWGYEFIFNMTYGFDATWEKNGAYWLEYGTWHRVPHVYDRIKDYDWIMYADVDYQIKDMTRPLESFINEFRLYGKSPSIFIPKDGNKDGYHTFSAFVFLIKNSLFGNTILENWMRFAKGLCPNGNFFSKPGPYTWEDSDQPGLWYSLVETHRKLVCKEKCSTLLASEHRQNMPLNNLFHCDNNTGLIKTDRAGGPEMNEYFWHEGIKAEHGSYGADLEKVPDDQDIIWSLYGDESRNGLGVQCTFGDECNKYSHTAFGLHQKNVEDETVRREIDICKKRHGCYAYYTEEGRLRIGCNDREFIVDQPIVKNKTQST